MKGMIRKILKLNLLYKNIKARCYILSCSSYKYYGGRGITLCDNWLSDKFEFIMWAIKSGYKIGLEIDRINVNGLYSPENCRWVTHGENCRNRRIRTTDFDKKTRICSKCKTEKSFSEFHKRTSDPAGITRWCKECCAEAHKKRKEAKK